MPVNQLWRQLKVRLLSTWYYTKPGVNVLTRKTGRFWTGIACHCNSFNCLKDTKKLQKSWVLPPETPPGFFIRLWSVEGGGGGGDQPTNFGEGIGMEGRGQKFFPCGRLLWSWIANFWKYLHHRKNIFHWQKVPG